MTFIATERQHLISALRRGDLSRALKLVSGPLCCCIGVEDRAGEQGGTHVLLNPLDEGGNTALHFLAAGEPLGLGSCLAWWLRRPHAPWQPARYQQRRAQLLACLLLQQPRMALLAGARNAAGDTPLHAAVLSFSWPVLALLLAALQQLLGADGLRGPGQRGQRQPQPAGDGLAALRLMLSVPDAAGLTPLELALQRRQWPAVRLLAAAARGAPALSLPQLQACTLVVRSLGGGGGFSSGARGGGGGGSAPAGVHVSAAGSSVTEALGGLLFKLWDAFGSSPADCRGASPQPTPQPGEGRGDDAAPLLLLLRLRPLSREDVLALVEMAERETAAAATAAAAATVGGGTTPGAAAAATSPEPGPAPQAPQTCIVCYEEAPPGGMSVRLGCGHATCDACWRGVLQAAIDEGAPQRAGCPQPGCTSPLPSAAAARLLPAKAAARFAQLQAQRYLATHPSHMRSCPHRDCGAMLHLPAVCLRSLTRGGEPGQGDAEEASAAAVACLAAGAGLGAECRACGHRFCWQCGEEAHEPASCEQMRRWEQDLAALRAAAPSADRQWLAANTKRCPQCRAHIQKQGGCLHMTCRGCGHHFCWSCGRAWAQHSAETGGFYHCALQPDGGGGDGGGGDGAEELAEYALGGGGGGGLPGPLAWVAGVWGSVRAAAAQHALQRQLRQYLRYSGGAAQLAAAAAHMRLLLRATGILATRGAEEDGGLGPLVFFGVSAAEASCMGSAEWGQLVAAAAASAADAAQPAALAVPAARASAAAALVSAAACSGSEGNEQGNEHGGKYLESLAAALAAARGLLQHAAVAAHLLPAGPARRHLQQCSAALQRRAGQLEPLLLALPEREAAAPHHPYSSLAAAAAAPPSAASAAAADGNSGGGGGGLAGWLLARLYGVEAPPPVPLDAPEAHPALAALPGDVLLQQLHFAAAVHEQRGAVREGVSALERDMRAMLAAARAGAYA